MTVSGRIRARTKVVTFRQYRPTCRQTGSDLQIALTETLSPLPQMKSVLPAHCLAQSLGINSSCLDASAFSHRSIRPNAHSNQPYLHSARTAHAALPFFPEKPGSFALSCALSVGIPAPRPSSPTHLLQRPQLISNWHSGLFRKRELRS